MAADRVVQHKHCITCGRAVPTDLQYCSEKCETEFASLQSRKQKVLYVTYGLMIFFVIVLIMM